MALYLIEERRERKGKRAHWVPLTHRTYREPDEAEESCHYMSEKAGYEWVPTGDSGWRLKKRSEFRVQRYVRG